MTLCISVDRKSSHHNTEDGNDLQIRNGDSQAPSNGGIHTPNDDIPGTTDNEDESIHDTSNEGFQAPNGVIPTPNNDTHDTTNGDSQTPIGNLRTPSPDVQNASKNLQTINGDFHTVDGRLPTTNTVYCKLFEVGKFCGCKTEM